MVPQIGNCGIIAICGIAEHCGFLNLNTRNSTIRNYPQFCKCSAIPQSTAIQLRNNCGIAEHLRNCGLFAISQCFLLKQSKKTLRKRFLISNIILKNVFTTFYNHLIENVAKRFLIKNTLKKRFITFFR